MTAQNIMMIYCGLLAAILLLGFIGGMIHGRRKATYKLVTTIIFYLVFFFTVDIVAIKLIDYPILTKLREMGVAFPAEFEGYSTIKELCAGYLASIGLTSDEIINVIMAFATVVAKIIYTLVFFIVIGIVYCILVNIIYYAFIRRKKARTKKLLKKMEAKEPQGTLMKSKKKKIKLKKHVWTGGLLGFVKKVPQVIVIIAVTTGILTLIPTIKRNDETSKVDLTANIESNELMDLIEQYDLTEYVKFVEMYRNSPFVKALGGDGDNKGLSGLIFDKLTKGHYEDFTLDTSSEMAFVLSTSAKAFGIMGGNTDINTLTVEQQKEMCALLKDLTDSKLIMNLLPIGASVALSLQQVKDLIAQNAPGLELDPTLFKDVNWETDIINISDTAMALVDLTGGFQNLSNLDYLHMDPVHVKTLTQCISNVSLLMDKVIPVIAEYAVTLPEVQELVGDISAEIKQVVWSDELVNVGSIYEKFINIGLESFDNIMGELTAPVLPGQVDKLDMSQELVTSVFASNFVSLIFPVVFNKVIEGQQPEIKQLFEGLEISEWDHELNTVIDLARDVRDNGGSITNLDLSIVRDVNVDTILRSELLTQGFTKIFTTYDQEGSIGQMIGLADYIYVPEELKTGGTLQDNKWYKKAEKKVDDKGNVTYEVEHRELADILTAFQKILPKEGEIDFNNFPQYILQIPDYYLTDEKDPNRDKTGYSSIFDSLVLRTSISNMVMSNEQIKDMVIVPETAAPTFIDNKVHVIKIDELNSMVKGIKALGIKDFTNIKPSYEMIENLNHKYESNIPGDTKEITNLDMILSSDIVYSTFSNLLIDMEEKSNGILVVPTDVKKEINTFNEGQHHNIELTELHRIIDAILVFDNLDFENPQFTMDMITSLSDEKIDTVSQSHILRNTITNVLKDYDMNDTVVIPVSALNEYKYIDSDELKSMIKGVKVLPPEILEAPESLDMNKLIKDLNNHSIEGDETSLKNVEIILKSNIVHSTISKYLIDATVQSNGMIIIPTDVKLPEEDRLANVESKSIKIENAELLKIVNAVNILPIDLAAPNVSIDTLLDIYYEEVKNADGTTTKKYNSAKGDADIKGIIDSAIINTTLTNVLVDQATPKEGQEAMIVIPDEPDKVTNKKPVEQINGFNYINITELQNVIKGFIALGIKDCIKPDGSFDFSPNIIKTLEDKFEDTEISKIEMVLKSNIVHTTLSHQINKAAKDFEGQIAIPLISDKKNDHYTVDKIKVIGQTELFNNITTKELKSVIHAFNLLDMDFSAGADGFDVNVIFDMQDSEIQELVASNIINLTISKTLIDQTADPNSPLVLPIKTFDLVDEYKFILPEQVSKLITGFNILLKQNPDDKVDFNNIKITTDMIKSLDDLYLETGKKKIEVILESDIVEATLSSQIINQLGKEGSVVIICDDVKVVDPTALDVQNKQITYIKTSELSNLIGAFNVLPIDLENPDVSIDTLLDMYYDELVEGGVTSKKFNEVKGDNSITKLINSAIINCTIANVLIDQTTPTPGQEAMIIIPNDGSSIFEKNNFNYINKVELQNVIKGFIALGLNDPKNKNPDGSLNINPNIIKTLETPFENTTSQKIDVVLKSGIVHATLSNQINKAASDFNGQIAIPEIVDNTNDYHTIDKIKVFGQTELFNNITTKELKSVIHAFNLLDMNFEAGTNSFDVNVIFDMTDEEIGELMASHIINLTISNNLIDKASAASSPLVLPKKSFDIKGTYDFIKPIQVTKLIKGLNILLKENETDKIDLDNIKVSPDMIKKLSVDDKLNTILESDITYATISKVLIDACNGSAGTIILPKSVVENDELKIDGTIYNNIEKVELNNLVAAMNYFDISFEGSTNIDAGKLFSLLDDINGQPTDIANNSKLKLVLDSVILDATISNKIFAIEMLKIDPVFEIKDSIDDTVKYLEFNELYQLIVSLKHVLGDTGSLDNIQLGPKTLISKTNKELSAIFSSTILRSTVAQLISDSGLVIPDDAKQKSIIISLGGVGTNKDLTLLTLTKSEVVNLFVAFRDGLKLDLTDDSFDTNISTTFDPAMISDPNRMNALYNSKIIKHKLTTTILGVNTLKFVDDEIAGVSVFDKYGDHIYMKNEEITALLDFANGTDLTKLDFTDVLGLLNNPELKEKIKSSLIIRSVIGNNIPKDAIGNTPLHPFKESDFIKAKEYNSENIINVLKIEWFGK